MLLLACALQSALWPVSSPAEFVAAEASAQPGDLIELQPGEYVFEFPDLFRVDVGVTVTVAAGGRASILSRTVPASISSPGLGDVLKLERLDFDAFPVFPLIAGGGLQVEPGAGSVWLEDCTTSAGFETRPGLEVDGANLVIRGGSFSGSTVGLPFEPQDAPPALVAVDSVVMAQDAEFLGVDGWDGDFFQTPTNPYDATDGGPGVRLTASRAAFSNCLIRGGEGGDGNVADLGSGGLYCSRAGDGGDAIEFAAGDGSIATVQGCELVIGQGGASNSVCQDVPAPDGLFYGGDGLDASLVDASAYERSLDAPATVAPGDLAEVTVTTPPFGAPRLLAISGDALPGLLSTLGSTSFVGPSVQLVVLPQSGSPAQVQLPVPSLPPGTPFATVFLQGVDLPGTIRFTAPVATTIR